MGVIVQICTLPSCLPFHHDSHFCFLSYRLSHFSAFSPSTLFPTFSAFAGSCFPSPVPSLVRLCPPPLPLLASSASSFTFSHPLLLCCPLSPPPLFLCPFHSFSHLPSSSPSVPIFPFRSFRLASFLYPSPSLSTLARLSPLPLPTKCLFKSPYPIQRVSC